MWFRHDNGGEYTSTVIKESLAAEDIGQGLTPWYFPELNGIAERIIRGINGNLRAMMESVIVYNQKIWAEAVSTWIYLKNCQPYERLKDQTP